MEGFFRANLFEGCKPCNQDGLKCVDDYATLKNGYWWEWQNETRRLFYENFMITLANNTVSPLTPVNSSDRYSVTIEYPYALPLPHKCSREESCMGGLDSSCQAGYKGPLCEVCSAGYYKILKTCKVCPTKQWMIGQLSVVVAVIAIVVAIVVWTSRKKSKKTKGRSSVDIILGRLKIVIGFYQVTFGLLEAFTYIKWPDSLAIIGKYSEVLQFNVLQIAPIHCLFPSVKVNAFGNLFAILAMNAAAMIISFSVYGIRYLLLMRSTLNVEQRAMKNSQTKELIYRSLFFFLYVTYLSTCSRTASVLPLACHKLCIDNEQKMCHTFLKADYTVKCEGKEYHQPVVVAYCTFLYIIFLPAASLIALWKQRRAPVRNKTEEEDVVDHESFDRQAKSTELLVGLRFLSENYNPHAWYWELVETARKVVLTSGLILVGGESRAYIGLVCVLSGLYGMFFAYKRPIVDPFENRLMIISLAVTFVNLGIGAVSKIPKENIPASIDSYVDTITFKILVFGANSLVIGLLVGERQNLF